MTISNMIEHTSKTSSLLKSAIFIFVVLFFPILTNAAEYFVDANNGKVSGDGSQTSPWHTLAKAWENAPSGATILVSQGNYGTFAINSHRDDLQSYITFKAREGETPIVEGVSINYPELQNGFIRFNGFNIRGESGSVVVSLKNVREVEIINSEVHGVKWASAGRGTYGFYILDSENVLIADSHIYEIHRGLTIGSTKDITIHGNYIQPKGGTGIQYTGGNREGVIESNHITGASYLSYPEDPDAMRGPHASIISVRSSDLKIKGNLLHGMGSSSGIMFYEPDAAGGEAAYSNITLANNVIFNTINNNAIRISNLGENFKLINNFVFSKTRKGNCEGVTKDARYRYNTALAVHSIGTGFDGSGLSLYNNIFVGALSVPETVRESHNVIWSWYTGSDWLATTPDSNSLLVASTYRNCGNHSRFFENAKFFEEPLDFSQLDDGKIPNFRFAANSIWTKFGDPTQQSSESMGTVGEDGFLQHDGVVRTSSIHSVGPYENLLDELLSPPAAPEVRVE